MRGFVAPISFGALLGILAIVTVVGVGLSVVLHQTHLIPILIGVILGVGLVYILLTFNAPETDVGATTVPGAGGTVAGSQTATPGTAAAAAPGPGAPPAPVDPVDLEPGYDPVEEADRLDSGASSPTSGGKNSQ